jgi:hypothetical protein
MLRSADWRASLDQLGYNVLRRPRKPELAARPALPKK